MAEPTATAIVIKAKNSALFDLTRFDGKLVAVGERGLVMQSTDEGKTWSGALTPTNRSLNSVLYLGDKIGLAGGHGGTLMRTADDGATWTQVLGIGVLAGIGFTMSLFIGMLAFPDTENGAAIRLGVLAASIVAGVMGYLILRSASPLPKSD